MKKQIAEQLVKALRSGDFKQGQGQLKNTKTNEHCCLGVLCNLASVEGICDYAVDDGKGFFDGSPSYLPDSVVEWAVMKSCEGSYDNTSLADDNDEEKTFEEIADIIEKHWEEL